MASIISAGTTSGTALNMAGDTSGILQLATNGSTTAITIDTSQRAAFVAGTAAAPAITTTGDTNTGIFFSAADTIDFAEGGTACGQFDSSANFKFNSGYGSVATAFGCRAWVNVSDPSLSTIAGSGNVTSITRASAGNYSVNFTNAMPDVNYAVVTGFQNSAWGQALIYAARTTTGVALQCGITSGNQDPTQLSVAIFR
jgi:hypothetical protein